MSEEVSTAINPAPQPSTGEGFLDVFYNILFHPVSAFRQVREADSDKCNRLLFFGLVFVLVVSGMGPMLKYMASPSAGEMTGLLLQVPLQAIIGLFLWLFVASILSLISYAFTGQGNPKHFLTLSAFATLPWILMAPLALIRQGLGGFGHFVGSVGGLGVWFWTVVLFALAIATAYRLTLDRVLIVLVMPFAMAIICLFWVVGFFMNAFRLFV